MRIIEAESDAEVGACLRQGSIGPGDDGAERLQVRSFILLDTGRHDGGATACRDRPRRRDRYDLTF